MVNLIDGKLLDSELKVFKTTCKIITSLQQLGILYRKLWVLVSVVLGFERSLLGNAKVGGLVWCKFCQLHAQMIQVKCSDFLVQLETFTNKVIDEQTKIYKYFIYADFIL